MTKQCLLVLMIIGLFIADRVDGQIVIDFEQLELAPNSFYNGSDSAGGFDQSGVHFSNEFDMTYFSWSGFSYSNSTDSVTAGFGNQYSAFAGGGANGSNNYAISYVSEYGTPARVTLPAATTVESIIVTNTTYTALVMQDGDAFAKKFGGPSGDDPDYFRLDILGMDVNGNQVGSVEFFLADFRSANPNGDYILDQWRTVDLTSLGDNIASLQFSMETTDLNDFGPNTPTYFALDDLTIRSIPEPTALELLLLAGVLIGFSRRSFRNESSV